MLNEKAWKFKGWYGRSNKKRLKRIGLRFKHRGILYLAIIKSVIMNC